MSPVLASVEVAEATLTTATWGQGVPAIVFLHDGLGSISQWRSVPGDVADRTGRTVLAYDRPGHGSSTPVPDGPWPADWLHTEAELFGGLLRTLDIEQPVLVGHSDGGSVALLHAASHPDEVAGVVALAPHSWVEEICSDAIAEMRRRPEPIVDALARHHRAALEVFEAWSGVWTSGAFGPWDIRPLLGAITAPVVVAQGTTDAYATDRQAIETAAAIGANAECRLLSGLGHLLHHDDAEMVVDLVVEFAGPTR